MRKKAFSLIILILSSCGPVIAQSGAADTLEVVNWNIEYFADPAHHNPATQVNGVRQIMNGTNADIYAICEVVNIDSFNHLVQSLNGNYGGIVSSFGSLASSPSSGNYAAAQKLGFIYRQSMVRNVSARAMLSSSPSAYSSFSSGRFPYQVNAEVLGKDNLWRPLTFIVMHAKAYSDYQSCNRRIDGCHELKDTLDRYFAADKFLLLGDYNDDLDVSICSGSGISNYAYMVDDSANYKSLTLPLSKAGGFSIDGYSSLIDNVIASNEMYRYYIPGSAQTLRAYVKSLYPNYDNDISDHFPVRTKYVLDNAMNTSVAGIAMPKDVTIYPQPARDEIYFGQGDNWNAYEILGLNGQRLERGNMEPGKQKLAISLPDGTYILKLLGHDGYAARLLTVMH